MKKLLLILSCGLALGVANAATPTAASAPMGGPNGMKQIPAECKAQMVKMHSNHEAIEAAIKKNDANKVGKLVIKEYNDNQAFLKSHPDCKMKRGMFGKMPPHDASAPM